VAQEESELVQPGVSEDVDDDTAAGGMNADRQPVWKIPYGARVAVADGDVGQVSGPDPDQRRQVRGLLCDRPEPHQVRILDDGVEHHQTLYRVIQRHRFPQTAFRVADSRVESGLIKVVNASTVVAAVVHRRVLKLQKLGEELPCLRTVDDPGPRGRLYRATSCCLWMRSAFPPGRP
jgi:hypothetical protein